MAKIPPGVVFPAHPRGSILGGPRFNQVMESLLIGLGEPMKKFLLGLLIGLTFGIAITAHAQKIVGGDGYLVGWTVTVEGGEVCDTPFVWTSLREIECD